MVTIAAFMVVCWLGWKFVRTLWRNRVTVTRYARIGGIVLLFAVIAMVTLALTIAFGDRLSAVAHNLSHDPAFPGAAVWACLLLGGAKLILRKRTIIPEARTTEEQAKASKQFRSFMGMGR